MTYEQKLLTELDTWLTHIQGIVQSLHIRPGSRFLYKNMLDPMARLQQIIRDLEHIHTNLESRTGPPGYQHSIPSPMTEPVRTPQMCSAGVYGCSGGEEHNAHV